MLMSFRGLDWIYKVTQATDATAERARVFANRLSVRALATTISSRDVRGVGEVAARQGTSPLPLTRPHHARTILLLPSPAAPPEATDRLGSQIDGL